MRSVRDVLAQVGAVVLMAACGSAPTDAPTASPTDPPTGSTGEAIIAGTASDSTQDAVVLLVHPFTNGFAACSGSMLTPKLVLTARHCLASTSQTVQCAPSGAMAQGSVSRDLDPKTMLVFAGIHPPSTQASVDAAPHGVTIFDDGANTLCNHDIALLLLDKPVLGANIAPIRLDGLPSVGAQLTLVGWGETQSQSLPSVRQQRTGVKVIAAGTASGLGNSEFAIGEGTCEGDSGGPALDANGAIAGASSRGGNDSQQSGPAGCIGAVNIYTAPLGFKDVILKAYQAAGQEPWIAGQPNPLLAAEGAACMADTECQSNRCDPTSRQCVAPAPSTSGASSHGGCGVTYPSNGGSRLTGGGAMLVAIALGALRRRRRGNLRDGEVSRRG